MATTTFLLTDIEGSTRLWEDHPGPMREALERHDHLIRAVVAQNGGTVIKHLGDGLMAAFQSAAAALDSAVEIQIGMANLATPGIDRFAVRIGVHSGEASEREGDYFGPTLNRVARLMAAGHGGQTLASLVTTRLADKHHEHPLVDLGEHRLRDLGRPEHIYQVGLDPTDESSRRLRTLDARLNNLPVLATSFIGREDELAALTEAVRTSRLVTVTGVGGAGKTRLALQAAADGFGEFPDGIWLVLLASVTDPTLVVEAIFDALELEQTTGTPPLDALADHLANRRLLLILDNCEHLIGPVADLVDSIMTRSPVCSVLATSRELLGVPGETAFGLRSMQLPKEDSSSSVDAAQSDAVRLFVERATAVDPHFSLSAENTSIVIDICRRLDGMPLAIELATARLRAFSVAKISELLDRRFRLLTGGNRTALPRQQTLEATIEWSYRLLTETEQVLFRRLSVFQGGFTLESVREICSTDDLGEFEMIELVPALVDKSLIVVDEESGDRYRLLETIRQFAGDRLDESGEGEDLRRRHASFFADAIEAAEKRVAGASGQENRAAILAEFDNLRQAMTFANAHNDAGTTLRLATGFATISLRSERWSEALRWYKQALAIAPEPESGLEAAHRLQLLGRLVWRSDNQDNAEAIYQEALNVIRSTDEIDPPKEALTTQAELMLSLAVVRFYLGQGGTHNEHFTELVGECLDLARRIGDKALEARCLGNLAHHADPRRDPNESRVMFDKAWQILKGIGTPRDAMAVAWQRASFEFFVGDLPSSEKYWNIAIDLAAKLELIATLCEHRVGLALTEVAAGDTSAPSRIHGAIRDLFALSEIRSGGRRALLQNLIVAKAGADAAKYRWDRVATAAGISDTTKTEHNPVRWDLMPYFEGILANARQALGGVAFDEARRRGATLSRTEIEDFLTSIPDSEPVR